MKFIQAAAEELIGLFVGDWTQTLTSVAILGAGWIAIPRLHVAGLAFALALAAQLVIATAAEARSTVRSSTSSPR